MRASAPVPLPPKYGNGSNDNDDDDINDMACPFAHFSRLTSLMDAADTATQAPTTARHAGPSKLTVRLKVGTAQAHREIEKSLGVRALMGSFHAEQSLHFDRLDHLNFLVMLACVYM